MRRRHKVATAIAGIVTVALGAVGLTNAQPQTLPQQPHALSEGEKDLLHEAEEVLTRSCMAGKGFRTWVVPRRPVPDDREFPYVIDDVEWASRHGYGSDISTQRDKVRAFDPNRRYFAGLASSKRQRALDALHGEKTGKRISIQSPNGMTISRMDGGCAADAQEELYGDLETWFRVLTVTDALDTLRSSMTAGDADFAKSVKDWSTCMHARGLPYETPQEARAAFLNPDRRISREREIRAAVTEARCAASSGLSRTIHRLDEQYGKRLRHQYENEVQTRLRMENEALPRARAAVRSS
ncbi:hypothetical protein [Streptomyces viridosporus]|uniref:hypothetical protein n=1 Tax=Streptomyces viridosporus TaxID=67581 RepID=UPI0009BD4987|nr:hypothetical protein [Streptomyces viridosporus]